MVIVMVVVMAAVIAVVILGRGHRAGADRACSENGGKEEYPSLHEISSVSGEKLGFRWKGGASMSLAG
jgi:hypothetical protein